MAVLGAILAAAASRGCSNRLSIKAEPDIYTPAMNSTVGISLNPSFSSSGHAAPSRYRWHASFGGFLKWNPPDYRIHELGPDTVTRGEKIYWSYDPRAMGTVKPPVEITAAADDAVGRPLAGAELRLNWKGDTAKVAGD